MRCWPQRHFSIDIISIFTTQSKEMQLRYTSLKNVAVCEVRQGVDLDVTLWTTEMTVTVTEKTVMMTEKTVTATEKTVTAEASLKDWLHKDTVERLTLYQYKDTVERLTLYQYENTVERLTLYQYKNIFHKIFILLTHSILLKHLKLFTFLSSYLLIFLSSYLLTFISFHHCTIWQSYNLTILFTLFTTNFLDYSAWLLTFSPTTAKYFRSCFIVNITHSVSNPTLPYLNINIWNLSSLTHLRKITLSVSLVSSIYNFLHFFLNFTFSSSYILILSSYHLLNYTFLSAFSCQVH
jgi:hypothetical protein